MQEDTLTTLRAQAKALERKNKMLEDSLRQAERVQKLLDKAVNELKSTKAALQESHAFLDQILTASPEPILVANGKGRILLANKAMARLINLPPEQLIGKRVLRLLEAKERRRALTLFCSSPTEGEEEFLIPGNHEERILNVKWTTLVEDNQGQEDNQIILAGKDITERKRAEKKILLQTQELRHINAELSTLYQVSSAIAHTLESEDLYAKILDTMEKVIPMEQPRERGIFTVEGEGDRIQLAAFRGPRCPLLDSKGHCHATDCYCGTAAKSGEVVVTPSPGRIIIPLKAKGRIVGVYYCYTEAPPPNDPRKLKTFNAIGDLLGIALDNARLYDKIKGLSLHDPLTGLANRRYMTITTDKFLAKAKRYNTPLSIIMLDIDYFKNYNDTYGHMAGDQLLASMAKLITREVRDADMVVRYGGEEFLIMLPEAGLPQACIVAERLRNSVGNNTDITISLGVASLIPPINTLEDLIRTADEALYKAKSLGRNRVETIQTVSV